MNNPHPSSPRKRGPISDALPEYDGGDEVAPRELGSRLRGDDEVVARLPRPAARILLVDAQARVLLFRFTPYDGRPPFWCTPGGKVDYGETYEQAARRELQEEVGLDMDCGLQVAQRWCDFLTIEGVEVRADERYFRVDVDACDVDSAGHTELERRVMGQWRWFTAPELSTLDERVYPEDLSALLLATAPAHAK